MTQKNLSDNREALKFLASLGVMKIVVTFDGGGDSGSISGIEIEGFHGSKITSNLKPPELDGQTVEKFIDEMADRLLEETRMDWYNNDGGYGEIVIVPGDAEKPIHMNMHIRMTSSQLHELELDEDGDLVVTKEHEPSLD